MPPGRLRSPLCSSAACLFNAQAVRVEHLEMTFIRLLHALAHHPDFNTTHDDLLDIAKLVPLKFDTASKLMTSRYVQFYLELMATQDNISLLYHLAMKGKTVRDPDGHTFSEASRCNSFCFTRRE